MEKFLLVLLVLGIAGFLKARDGDEGYEKMVIMGFIWLFGITAVLFVGALIYNRVLT